MPESPVMGGAWVIAGVAVAVGVGVPINVNRWSDRRDEQVDDYYERDDRDPPILGGTWPSGGGPL